MKIVLLSLGSFILLLILFLAWASYPWSLDRKVSQGEIVHLEPDVMVNNEEFPTVVKALTWNLGFLYGDGSEGPGYEFREKEAYEEKLNTLVKEILEWSPDVIFFQEIDFESSRSHDINQAEYLATKAGYPYVAMAPSWESNYIPFPYWPLSRHFGRMKSGGAILSKYPIVSHEIELFEKPASQPWWYNLFYLHRYLQTVEIEVGEKRLKLINLHLEAFDKLDRKKQVEHLIEKIKDEKIHIVAGDFNMVPKSATKRSKFPSGDEYEGDSSFDLMTDSGLMEVIPDEIYSQDESRYFTFPATKPDRRLDYIFYEAGLKMMRAEVLPSALSDHLPLRANFQIASPKFNPYSL